MPKEKTERPGRWVEVGVLVAILVVAAFLRFTRLDAVPPGMTHDEAAFGAEAEMILSGQWPIYFALGYGHEPLYAYLVALAFSWLGHTLVALRVTSAVCGLLVVLGTYVVAQQMFGVRVAWISAAWMAVAFWPLSLSRQALRAVTLPMLWLWAAWWFWRGIAAFEISDRVSPSPPDARTRRRALCRFAWSGLFLGLSFYTYMASRVTWLVFPFFAAYLILRRDTRQLLKRVWPGVVIVLVIAAAVAGPLVLYLRAHPAAEVRVDLMMGPIREFLRGRPERVMKHAWNALRVFSWVGDRFWAYNIPGRPILDGVGSALFYAGVLIALWRWREPRQVFLLIWLAVGMAPAMVTTNEGIFLRAIIAQPVTYILIAQALQAASAGIVAVTRNSRLGVARRWENLVWVVLALVSVTVEGVRTWRTYFIDWPSRPETRNIYNQNLVATARYLRDEPENGAVGISALYPLYYHDPWICTYVTGRSDLQVRWFDGRHGPVPGGGGIVYPGEGASRYIFSALTPLDPALQSEFESQAEQIERRDLNDTDQNPYFEVWRWRGQDALATQLDALRAASPMWVSPELQFDRPVQAPVPFGDVMALIGYRLSGSSFQPGQEVVVVTYWRALRTVQEQDDWKTFVHLLDGNSQLIGGVDVLHCPPTGWKPGDVVVQVHRFVVAEDVSRDQEAYLEVGVYRLTAGRLSVKVADQVIGNRVLLAPVQIQ